MNCKFQFSRKSIQTGLHRATWDEYDQIEGLGVHVWNWGAGCSGMELRGWVLTYGIEGLGVHVWDWGAGCSRMELRGWVFTYGIEGLGVHVWNWGAVCSRWNWGAGCSRLGLRGWVFTYGIVGLGFHVWNWGAGCTCTELRGYSVHVWNSSTQKVWEEYPRVPVAIISSDVAFLSRRTAEISPHY